MPTSKQFLLNSLENKNIQAVMAAIRMTEGTSAEDGYNYLFTSSPRNNLRFTDMSTHPNRVVSVPGYHSTAAGAYQILHGTYLGLCEKYGVSGFDKDAQDLLCVCLFDEHNILSKIMNGQYLAKDVQETMGAIWASQPASKYGQPVHSLSEVELCYTSHGGVTVG